MSRIFGRFATASVIYIGFAIYLYQPYFKNFDVLQYLIILNSCLASLGCFVLSRRWVSSFLGSLFAGAVYGFGPFTLGLAGYHPTAGFLTAITPWLFLPAAFGPKGKWQWLRIPLSALPFLAMLLFFEVSSRYRLFAIPTQNRLQLADLLGIAAPFFTAERDIILVGFYHIPVAALVMGFSMLFIARRLSILIIFGIGIVLASFPPLFGVSPIIWLSFPVLCCSIIIGMGMQGLCSAGLADRRWILLSMASMAVLAIATLLQTVQSFEVFHIFGARYENIFLADAKMYIAGTVALAIIFFIVRAKLRLPLLRWSVLGLGTAINIFFGARFIVDRIF